MELFGDLRSELARVRQRLDTLGPELESAAARVAGQVIQAALPAVRQALRDVLDEREAKLTGRAETAEETSPLRREGDARLTGRTFTQPPPGHYT